MTIDQTLKRRVLSALAATLLCLLPLAPAMAMAMADEVDDCGALVASPYEAGHEATGVSLASADLETAETVCNAAIAANPDSADAKAWMARIHYWYSEYDQAVALLEPAAEGGSALAQQLLGDILIDGLGDIPVDEARAIELLQASSKAGFAPGQNSLGVSYERGQGVTKDLARAAKLYAAANKQGLAVAAANLGMLYADGLGVEENDERANELFRSAAENGDAGGMNSLGVSYEIGEGIEKDLDLAMEWYRKAAAAGSSMAQANVGNLYSQGLGVEQSDALALKWISKSASSGNSYGQFLLGGIYEDGLGVPVDLDRAIEVYRESAASGNTNAESALIRLGETE